MAERNLLSEQHLIPLIEELDIKHFNGSREIAVEAELTDPNGSPVAIIEKQDLYFLIGHEK
jgi:hypothetical protein